jgi:hypothetical protein
MATSVRRRKFRKISIKLSDKEFKLLENCVEYDATTINKFIKSSMRDKFTDLKPLIKQKKEEDLKNQLSLFDFERKYNQMTMFEEYKEFMR